MLPLDDKAWNELRHGYGNGADIPGWIHSIAPVFGTDSTDDITREPPIWQLCHDWSTYDSTYAAIPHLVKLCRDVSADNINRIQMLAFVGWCVACLRLNRTKAPDNIIRWFEESVPIARDLIAESLPFAHDELGSQDILRDLLAAFATCHGNADLGFVLFELDSGGYRCDHCNEFVRPMNSSMNSFWVEDKQK